jgi:hypothetical protein
VIISQRDRARLEIERACTQLTEVIELFEDRERLPHAGELSYVQAASRPDPPAESQRAETQPAETQPAETQKAAQGEGAADSG